MAEREHHDVIVVGAGGAGAPVAARLSEDADRSVLLLEAGKDYPRTEDYPPELLDASTVRAMMPGHPADWGLPGRLTESSTENIVVNRGKVLGGSLSLNGTYFVRARKIDFDEFSAGGNDFWSYENVLPFYRRMETDLDYGQTELHGGSGPMLVRRQDISSSYYQGLLAGAAEIGIPEEADKNGEQPPGAGPITCNNSDGIRWNTGIAYINPVRAERPNLTVRGEAFVRRVLFEGTRAVGVEVERDGVPRAVHADLVMLAAGAMKTPHILMLSGVGPERELAEHGIPLVHHSPGVGKRFSDHPTILMPWRAARSVTEYEKKAVLAMTINDDSGVEGFRDDIEYNFGDKPFMYLLTGQEQPWPYDNTASIVLQKGMSRGTMRLLSADPHVYPVFDYDYFSEPVDVRRTVDAARKLYELWHTRAFAPLVSHRGGLDDPRVRNDDEALFQYILQNLITGVHMTGTAKFAVGDDPTAVVDQFGRVLGVEGVRVADTSILPGPTSRGPAATAVMIGEKIADHIRAS